MLQFRLPDPGEGLVEAEITSWRVAVGDEVQVNDILLEIETAKSLVELPSPHAGRVARLLVAEGDTVAIGTPVIEIDDGRGNGPSPDAGSSVTTVTDLAESAPSAPSAPTPAAPDAAPREVEGGRSTAAEAGAALLVGYGARPGAVSRRPRKGVVAVPPEETKEQVQESYATDRPVSRRVDEVTETHAVTAEAAGDPLPAPGAEPPAPSLPRSPLAAPQVRRLARDLGVDLHGVPGSGPGGVITREDVVAAADAVSSVRVTRPEHERRPLRGVRKAMVTSMTESLRVPQATAWVTIDVTETMTLVESLKGRREFASLRVSPLLVFAKAACLAIARNPEINSSYDEATGEIVLHRDVNLGIAAATPRGLIVPNIKQANELNLVELAQAMNRMIAVAREGRVQPSDMVGGTFTITNVGIFGVDAGTPILNPGEAAILCLGTVKRRPWLVGTGAEERIEPRYVCTVVITFDHRLVDGEMGSKFLGDVATILEDPGLSLLF
ncbi:dihydrolipoamide acetyltransferase family protein [Propionicicella superfundia]|uniref:dihydrolipoamide acetyltransferase family protein n=1 Tax=Propionicicella superfundia TaxID=348582 RepID=UPI0004120A95|nr:dihydrolipoamide acetyltransferase family protein [Propionicicella superfundia]